VNWILPIFRNIFSFNNKAILYFYNLDFLLLYSFQNAVSFNFQLDFDSVERDETQRYQGVLEPVD